MRYRARVMEVELELAQVRASLRSEQDRQRGDTTVSGVWIKMGGPTLITKPAPSVGVELEPILVSQLIEAANQHLARYGDTVVTVAISKPDVELALLRAATRLGSHHYCHDDEHESVFFEVQARAELDTS